MLNSGKNNIGCAHMDKAFKKKEIRCLVAEDNIHVTDIMSIFFKRNGIECDIAENGQIGFQMYMQNPEKYHVIFCDLQMPVMDGTEMMELIRKSGAHTALSIPIIAMSGTITGEAVSKERFSYLLKKPFELKYLLTIIDELMNEV